MLYLRFLLRFSCPLCGLVSHMCLYSPFALHLRSMNVGICQPECWNACPNIRPYAILYVQDSSPPHLREREFACFATTQMSKLSTFGCHALECVHIWMTCGGGVKQSGLTPVAVAPGSIRAAEALPRDGHLAQAGDHRHAVTVRLCGVPRHLGRGTEPWLT